MDSRICNEAISFDILVIELVNVSDQDLKPLKKAEERGNK